MKYRRAAVQIKSSLAANGKTIMFDLDPTHGFLWAGTSDLTAEEVLAQPAKQDRAAPAREEAKEFLRELLQDGKMRSKDVEAEAVARGINSRTLRSARNEMGIIAVKGNSADPSWYWQLV